MPYKEKEIEKRYWTIGEVADELQVSASLLRFWEVRSALFSRRRTEKGDRFYSRKTSIPSGLFTIWLKKKDIP